MRRAGCKVLERNARTKIGEIDLVCEERRSRCIVFVEVKSRWSEAGLARRVAPEVNITPHKRRKLIAVANDLVRKRGWTDRPLRIDVVAVEIVAGEKPVVRHTRSAVSG
jgi:putative endonuclease